ncbi:hypothetical protein [Streptomyces sp. NPDC002104]
MKTPGGTRELPPDVAAALDAVLDAVLSPQHPVHRTLRRQVPHLRVTGRCSCGCGTTYFDLDTDRVAAAPTPAGTVVAAEVQLCDAAEDCVGEILAFTRNGFLTWLEVCSWSDEPITLTDALRMLRPPPPGTPPGPPPADCPPPQAT